MKYQGIQKSLIVSFIAVFSFVLGINVSNETVYADEVVTYDVSAYGANGADQLSDRYAIQAALNNAKTTDNTVKVYIPDGTYYLDGMLFIYSDTELELSDNAVIKRSNGYSGIMLVNGADNENNQGVYNRSSNITLKGGTWDGQVSNPTSYDNNIYFGHAQNITIVDTTIKNCIGSHLLELTGVKNTVVSNVVFSGFISSGNTTDDAAKEALQLDTVTAVGSEFYKPYDNTPCSNITITQCEFIDYPCAIGTHSSGGDMSEITISDNSFKNISNIVIQMINYSDFVIQDNVQVSTAIIPKFFICLTNSTGEISGNDILASRDNAIYVSSGSDVRVENNKIKNASLSGIRVKNSSAVVNNNTISGCDNCGIFADASSKILANSNTITDCLVAAMSASDCITVEFINNVISNCSQNGISIAGGTNKTLVKQNKISVTGEYPIVIFGAKDSVISNNEILKGFKEYGIYLRQYLSGNEKCQNVKIDSNTITGGNVGIRVKNAINTCISNNVLKDASNLSIYVADGVSGSLVTNNYFGNDILFSDASGEIYNNSGKVTTDIKQGSDGKWYYYENGRINYKYTGLGKNSSGWWYVKNGVVDFTYTGLCKYGNSWYYIKNGGLTWGQTGLCQYNGTWYYYSNSTVDFGYTGLCKHGNNWYYIEKGVLTWGKTGLCLYNGTWYYYSNSTVNFNYTGLCKHGSNWYYIEKGVLTWGKIGLCLYNGTWYYYSNSTVNFSYTGLCKHGSNWYYIEKGVLTWGKTGLCLYNGTWYYYSNSTVNFNYTGLCKHGGNWYYVGKGVLTWGKTGLCLYNGNWWYYENSTVNFSYTGLALYNGTWYYVADGKIDWNYSGKTEYKGKIYNVKNGVLA